MMAKLLLGLNIAGLIVWLVLAFALPLHGQTMARARYQSLKSTAATRPAAEDDGAWVAGPAISAARTAANIGMFLALANVALPLGAAVTKKDKRKK